MPSRNLSFSASNDTSDLVTPRGFNNPEVNIFDKAFKIGGVVDSWDDWIQWEAGAMDLDFPCQDRQQSIASDASSVDRWAAGNDCAFEDAPFELDELSQSPHGSASTPLLTNFWGSQNQPSAQRRFSSLTFEEEKRLENIAMPYRTQSQIKESPESFSPRLGSLSKRPTASPVPLSRTRKSRKHKEPAEREATTDALRQSRQRGHNAIEKRYRSNLNDRIDCLRLGIPSLSRTSSSESRSGDECEDSDENGKDAQPKYGKAAILTRALDYIKHLESTTERLSNEVDLLKCRMGSSEIRTDGANWKGFDTSDEKLQLKSETLKSIQTGMRSSLHTSSLVSS